MKVELSIAKYGNSKKLQVDLISSKDPKTRISINSYYWKDIQDAEKLIAEIEAEPDPVLDEPTEVSKV